MRAHHGFTLNLRAAGGWMGPTKSDLVNAVPGRPAGLSGDAHSDMAELYRRPAQHFHC
ncbi:hypothetical protein LN650_23735 [Klebsiella pneumoniae subsp. pneumoniae]|nr:hypothetical protein [Klebsiella pneumoniae subsp. pneumoniae]